MPNGTITSTENTFGTVNGALSGTVAGTLTGSVGVPGPGVPTGGTAGQVLAKVDGVDYNTAWVNQAGSVLWGQIGGVLANQLDLSSALNLKAPLESPVFTGDARAVTAPFGDNDTSIATTAFVQAGLLGGTANARNLEVEVRNQSGSTIPAGSIVYISGATGNLPLVTLAQANNDANSAQTMGFTKTAIANNGTGYVIVRGVLENINTSALTEGVQLYLSPTTPGTWTTTKPSAPQHLVYVGIVIRSHPTLGTILVAVQNGYELNELHDVKITSVANGQVLKYDSAQGLWVNGTDSAGVAWGGITGSLSAQTDLVNALAAKYDASNPSGFQTASQVTTALAPYLLSATAASTYQTLAGMSSYLTTSAAASTYYPLSNPSNFATQSFVTGQGYITSAALTPYLLSSTAASTYQTISGMSSYLTTAAAASTYLTQANAASTYFTITAAAGKANLSGATFTGKVNFTPVAGASGLNVGIGGTSAASTTNGDLWISTGGTNLNFRDGTGSWRILVNTSNTNTFSAPQIIDTTSTTTALRVTQKGTGDAIRIEDDTSPDSTRFVINQFGKVGIGVEPAAIAALKVDTNGIMFGDDTVQTTAAAPFIYFSPNNEASLETAGQRSVIGPTQIFVEDTLNLVSVGISSYGVRFADNTVQITAAMADAPSDGNYYVRKDGAWVQCTVVSIYNSTDDTSYNCLTV
jgi:hypothetical protein